MSMSKDLFNNVKQTVGFKIQLISSNTTTEGEIIDRQGYESLTFFTQSGILTDGAYTFVIEDGDDSGLSDKADVSDDFLLGLESGLTLALTDDDKVGKIGYVGVKRFVRLKIVSAGTTTGGTIGAIALLGFARHAPDTVQLQS